MQVGSSQYTRSRCAASFWHRDGCCIPSLLVLSFYVDELFLLILLLKFQYLEGPLWGVFQTIKSLFQALSDAHPVDGSPIQFRRSPVRDIWQGSNLATLATWQRWQRWQPGNADFASYRSTLFSVVQGLCSSKWGTI